MLSDVRVYVTIGTENVHAGHLYARRRRGSESATFRYAGQYLAHPAAYALDPALPLISDAQHTALEVPLFRAFADSSPDRWGRNLIRRRERLRTREEGGTARTFGEFDLLLGVRDDLRQGAIRFRAEDPEFLATDRMGVPLLTDLSALLGAADREAAHEADYADLVLLVRAGSSLGGARPKAHVLDNSGKLAIAKFPSPASDQWNVMAWEKTALDLGRAAGIDVPDSTLHKIDGRDVLVVDRFDRSDGRRIGYVSALTMLEARDGEQRSYLDIAAVIEEHSASATEELEQLWRRIAFFVLISNTDDHLRNHGFLHQFGDVWTLCPAFDVNPNPDTGPKYLSIAVDLTDPTASIETLMAVAEFFRLGREGAERVLRHVVIACSQWRAVAARHGLAKREQEDMSPAFEHPQADRARSLTGL